MKRRSRIVSFRLSDDEYDSLKSVSANCGARSVSEFTRSVACKINSDDEANKIEDSLRILNDKMEMLHHDIQLLAEELRVKDSKNSQMK